MLFETKKDKLIVGYKQSAKAIASGIAKEVYLAKNCDPVLTDKLEKSAADMGADVFYIDTMKELGTMCGIDVGASCAVVIK